MVLVALLAVAIGGWVQVDQWKREELQQRRAMMRALPDLRLRRFFGRQGMRIVMESTEVEIINVDPRESSFADHWGDPESCPVTATGHFVEPDAVGRLSRVVLDGSKYFSPSDLPCRPVMGFRFRREGESLDIALSHASGDHFDIWAFQESTQGEPVQRRGHSNLCLEDPKLSALIREIVGDGSEIPARLHP